MPNDPRKTDFEKSRLENEVNSSQPDKNQPLENNRNQNTQRTEEDNGTIPQRKHDQSNKTSDSPNLQRNQGQGSRGGKTEEFREANIQKSRNAIDREDNQNDLKNTDINKRENENVNDSDPNRRKEKDLNRVTDPESFNNDDFNDNDVPGDGDDDANQRGNNSVRDKNPGL